MSKPQFRRKTLKTFNLLGLCFMLTFIVLNDDLLQTLSPEKSLSQSNLDNNSTTQIQKQNQTLVENKDEPTKNLKQLLLNEKINVGFESISYQITSHLLFEEYFNLEITGEGIIHLTIFPNSTSINATLDKKIDCGIQYSTFNLPISSSIFGKIDQILKMQSDSTINSFYIKIIKINALEIDFQKTIKIKNILSEKVQLLVSLPSDFVSSPLDRIQFIVNSPLDDQQLTGQEKLEMYINSKPFWPDQTTFDAKSTGIIAAGLIKTISSKNPLFCVNFDCKFRVTIIAKNISLLIFFPTILPNGSEIKLKESASLLEEIEPGEEVAYVFTVPKSDDNWVFTVIPYEGSVNLLINENNKPENEFDYKYKSISTRKEEIVVTCKNNQIVEEKSESLKKMFVLFKSVNPLLSTTFLFKLKKVPKNDSIKIEENYSESGVLDAQEIISYKIDLKSKRTESLSIEFRLEVYSGSANLYVKECLKSDINCKFIESDLSSEKKEESHNNSFNLARIARSTNTSSNLKSKFLILNFICVGHETEEGFIPRNNIPISRTCEFAIGVKSLETNFNVKTGYKLVAYGQGTLSDIVLNQSNMIKLFPKENKRFQIDLGKIHQSNVQTMLNLTAVSISGSCIIYLSSSSKTPSLSDYDQIMTIDNSNLMSVKTKVFKESFPIEKMNDSLKIKAIYLTVESDDFCVFELIPILVFEDNHGRQLENITQNYLMRRQIEKTSLILQNPGKKELSDKIYFKSFFFQKPEKASNLGLAMQIKIHLDSDTFGLKICIQDFSDSNDETFTKCKTESDNSHLSATIEKIFGKYSKSAIISIQKVLKPNEKPPTFPIDFTLKVSTNDFFDLIELTAPGRLISSRLHFGISEDYYFDLLSVKQNFVIYFTSPDPLMKVDLTVSSESKTKHIGTLNLNDFGLKIHDINAFKKELCSEECHLMISVSTNFFLSERFTLLFNKDDLPIILKEGEITSVANNEPSLFLFESNTEFPITFSIHNDIVESVINAKIVDEIMEFKPQELLKSISTIKFDFKTNIQSNPQISIPLSILRSFNSKLIAFFVTPKFSFKINDPENNIELFGQEKQAIVEMHSLFFKLTPFYQKKGSIVKNDMLYFYFNLDEPIDFSVIVTINTGEVSFFLNHGDGNLPTHNKFWKKSASLKGDEIVVSKSDLKSSSITGNQFYIGVLGLSSSEFSIIFIPDFKNLLKVKFQKLIDLQLEVNKNYYFDYFNLHLNYSTLLYASGSDVEISAMNYDKNVNNFISLIEDESSFSQKFFFKNGDLPRKKFFENEISLQTNTIIRIRALNSSCSLNFAIFDSQKPLEVYSEKRFTFTQNREEENIFVAHLGDTYDEVEVDVKLEFGSIQISLSEEIDAFKMDANMTNSSQKSFIFKVSGLEKSNDILIFQNFFLKVKSFEHSKFSILILPKDKFREIKAFEPEIVKTSSLKDTFVYYYLSQKNLKSIDSLVIDMIRPDSFDERPDLLFIPETDVVLNSESPFLPMPLIDIFERRTSDFIHFELRPEIKTGYYILKISKTKNPIHVKLSVSYNNQKNIETNGVHKGSIPFKIGAGHEYSMYISEPGEFRIFLESCYDLSVESARFFGEKQFNFTLKENDKNVYSYDQQTHITDIQFDDRFIQTSPFIKIHSNHLSSLKTEAILSGKVVRGFINDKGILKFRVARSEKNALITEQIDPTYLLMTEFRPIVQELILKDYIQIFSNQEELQKFPISHRISKKTGDLIIRARIPSFKLQLIVDYPKIKVIVLKLHYYLFSDEGFITLFEKCGLACLDKINYKTTSQTFQFNQSILHQVDDYPISEVRFNSSDLSVLSNSKTLTVFCQISARFFENEEELNQISLNLRYTSVPFFLLNFQGNQHSELFTYISAGIILSFFVFFIYILKEKKKETNVIPAQQYRPQNDFVARNNSQLEMSSISRNENA